jgi:hypothetical protein
MSVRRLNVPELVSTKPLRCSQGTKCISTSVDLIPNVPAKKRHVSQHVLIKCIPCQCVHKTHLNMSRTKASNASENTNCISACVEQTPAMPARTQNASQTCVDQTHTKPARAQNVSQHVFTKPLS